MVALSTADTNKWVSLMELWTEPPAPKGRASTDYELLGPIRQRQRRLTKAQMIELAARYEERATVCTN